MTTLTPQYILAMDALNDFYEMLFDAMQTAMPGAVISMNGAYVWRGYRIDRYQNMASSQYYCQIYPDRPGKLLFQESYEYKGKYRYYVMDELNFAEENFFSKGREAQRDYLVHFVSRAAQKAMEWQDSDDRKRIVPREKWNGTSPLPNVREEVHTYNQVPEVFLQAFPMQNKLLGMLAHAIKDACLIQYAKCVHLKENAYYLNWNFRGYRMKFKESEQSKPPKGPSAYAWRNYFEKPTMLTCEKNMGNYYRVICRFTLDAEFLNAPEEQQSERLYQFAVQSLQPS